MSIRIDKVVIKVLWYSGDDVLMEIDMDIIGVTVVRVMVRLHWRRWPIGYVSREMGSPLERKEIRFLQFYQKYGIIGSLFLYV